MNGIYDATDKFPFDKLILTAPTIVPGGNHFIKFRMNENPLYIQPPKCKTKQGIMGGNTNVLGKSDFTITKGNKRLYCDLMFTNENESFIHWMENLENYSQKYIFDNREKWFETDLELHDIENSFTSPMKLFKSGKYYIMRTQVPSALGKCNLKIYDETGNEISNEKLQENSNIMTILEFQGIKCSARSFQIEIELKQIMTMSPANLFEKCIIKTPSVHDETSLEEVSGPNDENNKLIQLSSSGHDKVVAQLDEVTETESGTPVKHSPEISTLNLGNNSDFSTSEHDVVTALESESILKTDDRQVVNNLERAGFPTAEVVGERLNSETSANESGGRDEVATKWAPLEDAVTDTEHFTSVPYSEGLSKKNDKDVENINIEFSEVDLDLDNIVDSETVKLKDRSDVYYKMYRDARRNAKIARDLALSSYLEAKRIKNQYMLEEIDSESDLDDDSELNKIVS
jgi:hypothetical protein